MDGMFGMTRSNLHKITKTLDENKQITAVSHIEKICSVLKDNRVINCTIDQATNVTTIVDATLVEGDTVDAILTCFRSKEGGGFCKQIIVQADEDRYQDYLDAQ